jgi:hypothetical protein
VLIQGQLISKVETTVWANPAPHITLDQLVDTLTTQGIPVLEVDQKNNRVKVLYVVDKKGV